MSRSVLPKILPVYRAAMLAGVFFGLQEARADYVYNPNDFANSVVSYTGNYDSRAAYDNPAAVLDQPPLEFNDSTNPNVQAIDLSKIIEPPYNYGPNGQSLLLVLPQQTTPASGSNNNPNGSVLTVKMAQPVTHDPGHLYGDDFIVFGSSFYLGGNNADGGSISDSTNLDTYSLSGAIYSHPVQVSVSPDDVNWFSFPVTSGLQPYNAYQWDDAAALWTTQESNPTVPLDPAIYTKNYAGDSASTVLDDYGDSAGGTAFDLNDATDVNGFTLARDGYSSIQYIRFASTADDYAVIASVSVVGVPEPTSLSLLALGGLLVTRRRRSKSREAT